MSIIRDLAAVLRFLGARFPGRTTFIKGFSDHEINATKTPAIRHCDVWSIDGAHSPEGVSRASLIAP